MAGATAGVFLFAFSFCVFLRPLGLYSGGFTGIAQIIHLVFQDILKIPLPGGIDWTGIIFWMLNIPLFLLSYVLISHSFFYKTIVCVCLQSLLHCVYPIAGDSCVHRSTCIGPCGEVPYPALEWV